MLSYLFVICGESANDPSGVSEIPDRVYIAPEEQAGAMAQRLFPGASPVEIGAFGRGNAAGGTEHILAAFDTLVGNFRVLYQDAERTVRIAFVLPETVAAVILDARLNGGLSAAEGISPGRVITTRGEGGRLALM
jgi:hypothetical protein